MAMSYPPLFEDLMDKFNNLKPEDMAQKAAPSLVGENDVVEEAKEEVSRFNSLLDQIKEVNKELNQLTEKTAIIWGEIGPEMNKLEDLTKLRSLLLRLQKIKEIHEKLGHNIGLRSGKQPEMDAKLLHCVDLFELLIKEYEDIEKSAPKGNPMRGYLKKIITDWQQRLKEKLEARFESVFKTVNWPIISVNTSPTSLPQASVNFDTFFMALLRLEINYIFDAEDGEESNGTKISICLPIELMIIPLKKRFIHHFLRTSRTNQLEKPEWYLTQTLNWIKDNEKFLRKNVDPLLRMSHLKFAPSKLQLTCGLVNLVATKLQKDLPEVVYDDKLFSHTFDEVLLFTRELGGIFGGNLMLMRANCDLFEHFAVEPYFTKLLNLERKKSTDAVENMLDLKTAWNTIITAIDSDEDEHKVPEVADNFIILLQSITERCSYLSATSHRLAFVRLEVEMLDDFRLRLSQLMRVNDQQENCFRWPFSQRYFAIINTLNYLSVVLEEWKNVPFFFEVAPNCLFEETLSLFKHMTKEMQSKIIHSLMNQVKVKMYPYTQLKWFCMVLMDDEAIIAAGEMLYFISSSLETLKRQIAVKIFDAMVRTIAQEINKTFLEDVILKNNFNAEGVQQMKRDIVVSMSSVFTNFLRKPETYFTEVLEACKILDLQKGTALLVQDVLDTEDGEKCLKDLGVDVLTTDLAFAVMKRRIFT